MIIPSSESRDRAMRAMAADDIEFGQVVMMRRLTGRQRFRLWLLRPWRFPPRYVAVGGVWK
jgi:hypothetical protein